MPRIEAQPAAVRRTVLARLKDALRPLEPYLPERESSLSWRRTARVVQCACSASKASRSPTSSA